jgi:hypothetical protein
MVVMAVMIWRRTKDSRESFLVMNYMHKRQNNFADTLKFLEEREVLNNPEKPRKPKAPQPQWDIITAAPASYAAQRRGRVPVSSQPGCPLGGTGSLIMEMQEINATTAGHWLGMNETELLGTGARTQGAFDLGGNQEAARIYPRAPTAINMQDMMERR